MYVVTLYLYSLWKRGDIVWWEMMGRWKTPWIMAKMTGNTWIHDGNVGIHLDLWWKITHHPVGSCGWVKDNPTKNPITQGGGGPCASRTPFSFTPLVSPTTRLDDYDTFWAKVKYSLTGFIFLVDILEKWGMEMYSSVEAFLLVPAVTWFTQGFLQ